METRLQPTSTELDRLQQLVGELCVPAVGGSFVLSLGQIGFFKPAGLVVIAARIRDLKATAPRQGLADLAGVPGDVRRYLSRIDFFNVLGIPYNEKFIRWPSYGRFVPITPLVDENTYDKVSEQISDVITVQGKIKSKEIGDDLYIVLNELSNNFYSHARAQTPGLVCAQAYPEHSGQPGCIEVAMADTGIGLRGSLLEGASTRASLAAGESPCRLATQFGVTSKTEGFSGYGLYLVRELVRRNGGLFRILSGDEVLTIGRTEAEDGIERLTGSWRGTIVAFRLSMDGPVSLTPIYEDISRRLGADNDV